MRKIYESLLRGVPLTFAAAVIISIIAAGCTQREESHVPGQKLLTLTTENFQAEVIASSQPTLVDFWAAWCGPCKVIAPTVAELAVEFEGKAKVGKVDVDAQTELAQKYSITAIPALLIFKDGKVVERFVGVREKSELKTALAKFVNAGPPSAPTNNP